jgi:hypothetical protein
VDYNIHFSFYSLILDGVGVGDKKINWQSLNKTYWNLKGSFLPVETFSIGLKIAKFKIEANL